MSNALGIEHLLDNTDHPEDVVNAAIDALADRITNPVVLAFSASTYALDQATQALGSKFSLTAGSPTPGGPYTLEMAAVAAGLFFVENGLDNTVTIEVSGQPLTAPTLAAGNVGLFYSDGVNVESAVASSSGITALTGDVTATGPGSAAATVKANLKAGAIEFLIDGAGSVITTGLKGYVEVPFDCTINRATLLGDQSGSIVVNVYKCTYSQFDAGSTHPVAGDKITASAPPTISSATKAQDSTLTGWTTSISAGDILAFNVDSVTTLTRVTLSLKVAKT